MAARVRAKRREEDEVFVMEARLKLLKEQMATERKKREDALSKNGSGSVWLAGRAGPLRGVRDVRSLVRQNARERAARPASATSAADTEATGSLTEQLIASHDNTRPWTPGAGDEGWTAQGGVACGPERPLSPPDAADMGRPSTAPQKDVEVAAMECQTMDSGRPRWAKGGVQHTRPSTGAKRTVAKTYLQKILEARSVAAVQQQ